MNLKNQKTSKVLFIVLMFQLNFSSLFSQNSYELGIIYSPTLAELAHNRSEIRLLHSFGIIGRKNFKSNIFISSGLYFRRLGNKLNATINTDLLPAYPSGQILKYELKYMTTSLDVPINIGYRIVKKNNFGLGIELGLNSGILLNQKSRISIERRTRNIRVYSKFLLSATAGIKFDFKISEKINLNFRPAFLHQINKNRIPQRQRAILFDIGVGYKL